jgi:hypothetical protein
MERRNGESENRRTGNEPEKRRWGETEIGIAVLVHVRNLCGLVPYPVRPERSGAQSKDAPDRLRVSDVEG